MPLQIWSIHCLINNRKYNSYTDICGYTYEIKWTLKLDIASFLNNKSEICFTEISWVYIMLGQGLY